DETLAQLGIAHLAARPTHHLSYGERKRVALAGAVAMRPDHLLLDEPTAGLDPEGVHELLVALDGLDSAILLATHHVAFALAWADEVAVVVDGQVRQGPVSLLGDADLLAAARLHRPWPLELAARLGLAGTPRHLDDVTALLEAR
ncbi:ATP-binding cassette domain-containing protein, partial [Tessaracoccus lubricantis]